MGILGTRPHRPTDTKEVDNVNDVDFALQAEECLWCKWGRVRLKHHFLSCVEFPFVNTTASSAISGQQVVTREGVWDT